MWELICSLYSLINSYLFEPGKGSGLELYGHQFVTVFKKKKKTNNQRLGLSTIGNNCPPGPETCGSTVEGECLYVGHMHPCVFPLH